MPAANWWLCQHTVTPYQSPKVQYITHYYCGEDSLLTGVAQLASHAGQMHSQHMCGGMIEVNTCMHKVCTWMYGLTYV